MTELVEISGTAPEILNGDADYGMTHLVVPLRIAAPNPHLGAELARRGAAIIGMLTRTIEYLEAIGDRDEAMYAIASNLHTALSQHEGKLHPQVAQRLREIAALAEERGS